MLRSAMTRMTTSHSAKQMILMQKYGKIGVTQNFFGSLSSSNYSNNYLRTVPALQQASHFNSKLFSFSKKHSSRCGCCGLHTAGKKFKLGLFSLNFKITTMSRM